MSPTLFVTLLVLCILFLPPIGLIAYYKLRDPKAIKKQAEVQDGRIVRKYAGADVAKKRGLFVRGAMVLALGALLVAFTFTPPDNRDLTAGTGVYSEEIEMQPPPTVQPPPEVPPPPPPPDIEIQEDPEPEDEPEDLQFTDPDDAPLEPVYTPPPPVEKEPEIVKPLRFVEQQAEFPGGEAALRKYLADNIKYPSMARENNIEGTVYTEFVVGADGSVSDIKILRGLPGGCNEEVIRVLERMPRWNPGRQTGRPVPVYFQLPVVFKFTQ